MRTYMTLLKNEFKLNLRDMNMVIFAWIMPLMVLGILFILYRRQSAFEGADYTFIEQSFGAMCAISMCAGGLMGLPLVVSEYRERKILKRFFVTPVSPALLLAVEFSIYVLYALGSLLSVLAAVKLLGGDPLRGGVGAFFLSWLLTLVSTLSIGMLVGGVARNTKTAGVIASALYFPMLVFSGATLPLEAMPPLMQRIVQFLPLTKGIQLMKATSLGLPLEQGALGIGAMIAVCLMCSVAAVRFFRWE